MHSKGQRVIIAHNVYDVLTVAKEFWLCKRRVYFKTRRVVHISQARVRIMHGSYLFHKHTQNLQSPQSEFEINIFEITATSPRVQQIKIGMEHNIIT